MALGLPVQSLRTLPCSLAADGAGRVGGGCGRLAPVRAIAGPVVRICRRRQSTALLRTEYLTARQDDTYDVYDKPMRSDKTAAVYRPSNKRDEFGEDDFDKIVCAAHAAAPL